LAPATFGLGRPAEPSGLGLPLVTRDALQALMACGSTQAGRKFFSCLLAAMASALLPQDRAILSVVFRERGHSVGTQGSSSAQLRRASIDPECLAEGTLVEPLTFRHRDATAVDEARKVVAGDASLQCRLREVQGCTESESRRRRLPASSQTAASSSAGHVTWLSSPISTEPACDHCPGWRRRPRLPRQR